MDIESLRSDFPVLNRRLKTKAGERNLVYLDNAATSQKPTQVINALSEFYSIHNANVHRGLHTLSEEATTMYEESRKTVASFLNAEPEEIVFVRNATEGINLVSRITPDLLNSGPIITTIAEHHSNYLPWLYLSKRENRKFIVLDLQPNKSLSELPESFSFLAVSGASNVLGYSFDIRKLIREAHTKGALALVDASQLAPHKKIDVKELGPDFLVFTGHKVLGPTGIGVLYINKKHLPGLSPFLYGGDMVRSVSLDSVSFAEPPARFEAGTPNIAGAIGLSAALNYISSIGWAKIQKQEHRLTKILMELSENLSPICPEEERDLPLLAFNPAKFDPHDFSTILDMYGIATRSGFHCAQPLHIKHNKSRPTTRASAYFYNTEEELLYFASVVKKILG